MTRVGWLDERDLAEEVVLRCHQDEPEVSVLSLAVGTLNRHRFHGDKTIGVLNGHVVRFLRMLGEGGGWEAASNGINRLGVHHCFVYSLEAEC